MHTHIKSTNHAKIYAVIFYCHTLIYLTIGPARRTLNNLILVYPILMAKKYEPQCAQNFGRSNADERMQALSASLPLYPYHATNYH